MYLTRELVDFGFALTWPPLKSTSAFFADEADFGVSLGGGAFLSAWGLEES